LNRKANIILWAIIAFLLFPGEKPEWLTITGMIIITGSLVMFFRNNKESKS
jgi:drug/metabolite transporter (DMT)-like permease